MERLTRWVDDTKDVAIESKEVTKDDCLKRLAEYEDTGFSPDDIYDLSKDFISLVRKQLFADAAKED